MLINGIEHGKNTVFLLAFSQHIAYFEGKWDIFLRSRQVISEITHNLHSICGVSLLKVDSKNAIR